MAYLLRGQDGSVARAGRRKSVEQQAKMRPLLGGMRDQLAISRDSLANIYPAAINRSILIQI
jgi:hypothetical protein